MAFQGRRVGGSLRFSVIRRTQLPRPRPVIRAPKLQDKIAVGHPVEAGFAVRRVSEALQSTDD